MIRRLPTIVSGAAVLALTVGLLALPACSGAADEKSPAPAVPAAELAKLIEQNTKILDESLTGDVDKKSARTAYVAAVMIAASAQRGTAGPATPKDATLRDAALNLVPTIKDGNYADAKKQAQGLAKLAPKPAKMDVALIVDNLVKLEDVMSQFSGPKSGGLGIELKLEDLDDQKGLKPADLTEELLLMVDRATLVADLVKEHDTGGRNPQWKRLDADMRQQSVALADAIRAKDVKAATNGVANLNKSCTACHDVFK